MQKKDILKLDPGPDGKFLLKMPLLYSVNKPGCNDRIFHIFLIKMKIVMLFEAL